MRKKVMRILSLCVVVSMTLTLIQSVHAAEMTNVIKINEVNSSPDDWVEVMNLGTETMELSGYEIRDNSDDHRWQFVEGHTVEAGGLFVYGL